MSSTKPTILLVPGSFSSSALAFDTLAQKLRKAGYDVIAVELLTVGPPSTAPPKTMEDDAAHIHGIAEQLMNDGKDVIIAMNSYGGVPGTEAAKNLSRKEREAAGKKGALVGLVYLSALLVNVGESLSESLGSGAGLPDYLKVSGEYMYLEASGNAKVTFNDLSPEEGLRWAQTMSGHATNSFMGKLTTTSHYDIPITYVYCTEDQVIPPSHQMKMIEDMRKVSKSSVDVFEIKCGHAPMLSRPDEVLKAIAQAAGKA